MKLWKVDAQKWEVREVDGEPFPGQDSEGDTCYANTHLLTKPEAIAKLRREADAYVQLAAMRVLRAEAELDAARVDAANAVKAAHAVADFAASNPA